MSGGAVCSNTSLARASPVNDLASSRARSSSARSARRPLSGPDFTSAGLAPMNDGVVTMVVPFTTVKLNDRWWPSIFQPQFPPGWGLPNTQK